MKKRIFALILTGTILAGAVSVYADNKGSFSVDGKAITATIAEDDKIMVPVREAAQALGYKVEWIAETKTVTLTKGAVYITFAIGNDGYTVAKTAPMPLGRAAEVREGKTFVPVELFTEIMGLTAGIEGSDVNIITVNELNGIGTVNKIDDNTISFQDGELGEVILHIGDNTMITDNNSSEISLADITEGSEIEVVYGDAMMESMPPQNNPKSIILKSTVSDDKTENLSITGVVKDNKDGYIHVVSSDENAPYPEVVLIVTDETAGDGINADEGDKVQAEFSPRMTRSIPPQSQAISVMLIN